jgi:hypothetical protein
MRTVSYLISITIFSALMISPIGERKYHNTKVSEQKLEIILKEKKLEQVIILIEQKLKVNPVGLKN